MNQTSTYVRRIPNYKNRTAEAIITEWHSADSYECIYRAMSWLDHFERNGHYPSMLYAAIEGRSGVEHLIFEEIVISTGASLTKDQYNNLLKNSRKLEKKLFKLTPDYMKLQTFTRAVHELNPNLPPLVFWDIKALMRAWGTLSKYLHWNGAKNYTSDDQSWRAQANLNIKKQIEPIWIRITSGDSGIIHPTQMTDGVREIWQGFKDGNINHESLDFRLRFHLSAEKAKSLFKIHQL